MYSLFPVCTVHTHTQARWTVSASTSQGGRHRGGTAPRHLEGEVELHHERVADAPQHVALRLGVLNILPLDDLARAAEARRSCPGAAPAPSLPVRRRGCPTCSLLRIFIANSLLVTFWRTSFTSPKFPYPRAPIKATLHPACARALGCPGTEDGPLAGWWCTPSRPSRPRRSQSAQLSSHCGCT
jgi:hypothetical protein